MGYKISNIAPLGVGKAFVEVDLPIASSGTTAATSAAVSLGQSYSSIKPISITVQTVSATVQVAYIPDTASTVKFRYLSTVSEAITIRAIFECVV